MTTNTQAPQIKESLLKPRDIFEQAARAVIPDFSTRWPRMLEDLTGCLINFDDSVDGQITIKIKGMDPEKAEYYNDHFARALGRALVGVLNIGRVDLIFTAEK